MTTLQERIAAGEAAITRAKTEGRDVSEWEAHLAELKKAALVEDLSPRAWVVEVRRDQAGNLLAVMICSAPLEAHLWVAIDRSFQADDLAIYYYDEVSALKTKTVEDLREIHKTKLIFPGARVIQ